jgi:hypothetical protein
VGRGRWLQRGRWHLVQWAVHGGQGAPRGDVDTSLLWLFWNGGHLSGGGESAQLGHWLEDDKQWWADDVC